MRANRIYDRLPAISRSVCEVTGIDIEEWGSERAHEPPLEPSETAGVVMLGGEPIVAGVDGSERTVIWRLVEKATQDEGYLQTLEARYHLERAITNMWRFAQSDLSLLGGNPRIRRNIGRMYAQLSQVAVDASLCAGPTSVGSHSLVFDLRTADEALAACPQGYIDLLPVMLRPQRGRVSEGLARLHLL